MLRVVRSAAEVRLNSKALLLGGTVTIVTFINCIPGFKKQSLKKKNSCI